MDEPGEVGAVKPLPYGRQSLDEADVKAVVEVLESDWLTTGPKVGELEASFAEWVGATAAVAVNSGTAALHAAVFALDIGPGDEVLVPALTFAASANCVLYQGATPVFVDVDSETLLVDPRAVADARTPRTRALVAVDYAGQPCDYDALQAAAPGLPIISDACHAPGAKYKGRAVGTLGDLSTFSLHPVKHFTAGEGGLITTEDPALGEQMRAFRNHGITSDARTRELEGAWYYEMQSLGYNYRLTDFQCALALSQLGKLQSWVTRRRTIAGWYDRTFANAPGISGLTVRDDVEHAYHLYVVKVASPSVRERLFKHLRGEGIGVNVHYIPVHLHPFYRRTMGTSPGLCPIAEEAHERILSLPMFPGMTEGDVRRVADACLSVTSH